jgi:hypothetical protein
MASTTPIDPAGTNYFSPTEDGFTYLETPSTCNANMAAGNCDACGFIRDHSMAGNSASWHFSTYVPQGCADADDSLTAGQGYSEGLSVGCSRRLLAEDTNRTEGRRLADDGPVDGTAANPTGVSDLWAPNIDFKFSPLEGTRHRTLSSARFFPDAEREHEALAIGTGKESPNAIAYLGVRGFEERIIGSEPSYDETVAVAAARIDTGINLICFANRRSQNVCHRYSLSGNMNREHKIITDLQGTDAATRRQLQVNDIVAPWALDFCPFVAPEIREDTTFTNSPISAKIGTPIGNVGTPEECQALCASNIDCNYMMFLPTGCAAEPETSGFTISSATYGTKYRVYTTSGLYYGEEYEFCEAYPNSLSIPDDGDQQFTVGESLMLHRILGMTRASDTSYYGCGRDGVPNTLEEAKALLLGAVFTVNKIGQAIHGAAGTLAVASSDSMQMFDPCCYSLQVELVRITPELFLDGQCWLYASNSKPPEAERENWRTQHLCRADADYPWQFERVCENILTQKTGSFAFGNADEDTTDIKINFLDADRYVDIVTVSGRDHLRIYRGTNQTQLTGDFSAVVPETVYSATLQAIAAPVPPPPPSMPVPDPPPESPPPSPKPPKPPPPSPCPNTPSPLPYPPPPSPAPCKRPGLEAWTNIAPVGSEGTSRACPGLCCEEPPDGYPGVQCYDSYQNGVAEYEVYCCESYDITQSGSSNKCRCGSLSCEGQILTQLYGRRLDDSEEGLTAPRELSEEPYSRFPGDARVDTSVELANAQQIFIADFDNNGRMDLFLHSPAPSAGSCAMRCHEQGRFGYDSFEIRHANVADDDEAEPTFCYCGPKYDVMVAPFPPPSPPKPPPEPPASPPTPAPSPLPPPPPNPPLP